MKTPYYLSFFIIFNLYYYAPINIKISTPIKYKYSILIKK